jgi:ribosome production factor 1
MAPPRSSNHDGNVTHIGNKHKRQELVKKFKADKAKAKLQRRKQRAKEEALGGEEGQRKRVERLSRNVPRTIENTREFNATILNAPNTHPGRGPREEAEDALNAEASSSKVKLGGDNGKDDEEDEEDEEDDEEEAEEQEAMEEDSDIDEDPHAPPAIIITTSLPHNSTSPHLNSLNARSHPFERTRDFIKELLNVFPGAEYRSRAKAKGAGLGKIASWGRKRGYNGMMVIGEDASSKKPVYLTLIRLPKGPTAFFRLTSIAMGKEIYGHARPTPHTPELILNNFTTALGHSVGKLFQSLFPKIPQLEGRQVVTAHNQRDYVFFRRHRYMFASEDRAKLQEIGPRFTLKLRSLKQGLPKGAGQWDGEVDFDGSGDGAAAVGGKEEREEEERALKEMEQGGPAASSSAEGKNVKKTQRGDTEETGRDFEWKVSSAFSDLTIIWILTSTTLTFSLRSLE